ncbi:uncharacterized protein LOC125083376 [Lutra lutra]|uniref:uncharacterized protein LOC125083376 n=1 Tax=Lutra lutra TaxID=9657 RepID=UPI001FD5D06C|nr:uncharacterized protein LOC125083376 [Lutra lutra]
MHVPASADTETPGEPGRRGVGYGLQDGGVTAARAKLRGNLDGDASGIATNAAGHADQVCRARPRTTPRLFQARGTQHRLQTQPTHGRGVTRVCRAPDMPDTLPSTSRSDTCCLVVLTAPGPVCTPGVWSAQASPASCVLLALRLSPCGTLRPEAPVTRTRLCTPPTDAACPPSVSNLCHPSALLLENKRQKVSQATGRPTARASSCHRDAWRSARPPFRSVFTGCFVPHFLFRVSCLLNIDEF